MNTLPIGLFHENSLYSEPTLNERREHNNALRKSGLQLVDENPPHTFNCMTRSVLSAWPEMPLDSKCWIEPSDFEELFEKFEVLNFKGSVEQFSNNRELMNSLDNRCIIYLNGIHVKKSDVFGFHTVTPLGIFGSNTLFVDGKHGKFSITQGGIKNVCLYYNILRGIITTQFKIYRKPL